MIREQKYRRAKITVNGETHEFYGWTPKELRDDILNRGLGARIAFRVQNLVTMYSKKKHIEKQIDEFNIVIDEFETRTVNLTKRVLRPMEEFNGYTPQDSLDYIKSQINVFECDDERLSDAIKRLQVLIDEAN